MKKRTESDSLGNVEVPSDKYYGAQTQRSKDNFRIGNQKIPFEVIYALASIKKAAAITNCKLKILSEEKRDLIIEVCDEIIAGKLNDHFPLVVWQTGSGTQTNMNVNEVISNRAIEKCGGEMGSKKPIHPNDDVNKSQSSNDVFPTAMHISAYLLGRNKLAPSLQTFLKVLEKKQREFKEIIKVGRTHLMDATPISIGQEFSGYAEQIRFVLKILDEALENLTSIALGGTAVGTGLNSPKGFDQVVAKILCEITGYSFIPSENKFFSLSSKAPILHFSSCLKLLACELIKIANDIRWAASGPRSGISELILPSNEPGSSIMPGKVNPTQCESMTMVAAQVIGNDATISFAASQGNFQLNVYMPVIIYNLLESIHLLSDSLENFTNKCLENIRVNEKRVKENLDKNLMLATVLSREIGYDKASQIVKKAYRENSTLKQAATELNLLSSEEFDRIMDYKKMIYPYED